MIIRAYLSVLYQGQTDRETELINICHYIVKYYKRDRH